MRSSSTASATCCGCAARCNGWPWKHGKHRQRLGQQRHFDVKNIDIFWYFCTESMKNILKTCIILWNQWISSSWALMSVFVSDLFKMNVSPNPKLLQVKVLLEASREATEADLRNQERQRGGCCFRHQQKAVWMASWQAFPESPIKTFHLQVPCWNWVSLGQIKAATSHWLILMELAESGSQWSVRHS